MSSSGGSAPLGTTTCSGLNGLTAYCMPYQSCCAGLCCSSDQTCRTLPTPSAGYTGAVGSYCADDILEGMGGIRVVFIPAVCVVVLLLGAALLYRDHLDRKHITFPALITTMACIFIMFNPAWPTALLVVLSCFFVIGATKNNQILAALIAEIIVFAIFLGGLGIGIIWVNANNSNFFDSLASNTGPGASTRQNIVNMQISCAQYYNYFWQSSPQAWNADPAASHTYWGYCSQGYLATVQFFQVVVLGGYFLLIVATISLFSEAQPDQKPAHMELAQRTGNDQAGGQPQSTNQYGEQPPQQYGQQPPQQYGQ